MPELPEVETMVRDLRPRIIGRRIAGIDASFTGSVIWPGYREFVDRVQHQAIMGIERRGKYALFPLASGDVLIIHRGMTGSLLHRRPEDPLEPYVRLTFQLDDASELRFRDPRKFGKVFLIDAAGEERPLPWAGMGPEPLDDAFTPQSLSATVRGRKVPIKPLLLDQRRVAGLGNIYVDEALFRAGIHPQRQAGSLQAEEVERLHAAIQHVLGTAITHRGTTFNNYTDIEGRRGQFQDNLQVFHRTGEPCPRCHAPIIKFVLQGRGTHVCSACQRV